MIRKHYFKIFILSLFCFLTALDADAQKIEGKYYPENDSFVITETPYSRSLFKVQNPCIGGHCVIEGKNYQGIGIIDTAGFIVFEPQESVEYISIISTPNNLYFIYKYYEYSLLICKDKPSLSSKCNGRYIFMYTEGNKDVFFEEHETRKGSNYNESKGNVFEITNNVKSTLYEGEFLTENLHSSYSKTSRSKSADNVFYKNLLIYKSSDNNYNIKNLDGTTYIQTPNIKSILGMDKLSYISKSGYSFELHEFSGKDSIIDQFETYSIVYTPKEHIVYQKNGKQGCYMAKLQHKSGEKSKMVLYHVPPIFDSIQIGNSYYNRYRMYKGDTIFTYNSLDFYDTFNYSKSFATAEKIGKHGNVTTVGRNGIYNAKGVQLKLGNWAPQSGWLGIGLNSRDVLRKNNPFDTVSINAFLLEGGMGWYSLETDGNFLISSWNLYGGGIGLEYRTPFMSKDSVKSITGSKYSRTYLNARIEYAGGVAFLIIPVSIHLQLGYSTNFKEQFIKPGIGISFYNLVIGGDVNLLLKKDSNFVSEFGLYLRYIITEE